MHKPFPETTTTHYGLEWVPGADPHRDTPSKHTLDAGDDALRYTISGRRAVLPTTSQIRRAGCLQSCGREVSRSDPHRSIAEANLENTGKYCAASIDLRI